MSTTRQITVWCDGTDCVSWEYAPTEASGVREARRALGPLGWRFTPGLGDLCPKCSGNEQPPEGAPLRKTVIEVGTDREVGDG